MHSDTWQLQEAKAKLSELIDAAMRKPQTITVRGEEKAVILSKQRYGKLLARKKKMSLGEFLDKSPLKGLDLEPYIRRRPEFPRNTRL